MNKRFTELTEDEQEFLHQMFLEEDDFDEWAERMNKAIESGEIKQDQTNSVEIEFDLDDFM